MSAPKSETPLHTHVVRVERTARVIESSPYDPGGAAMRQ